MTTKPPSFDVKDPGETVVLTFDATPALAPGETLTGTPTVAAEGIEGGDEAAPTISLGASLVNTAALNFPAAPSTPAKSIAVGCAAQVVATAGGYGSVYLIRVTCTTSNPNKVLVLKAYLPMAQI